MWHTHPWLKWTSLFLCGTCEYGRFFEIVFLLQYVAFSHLFPTQPGQNYGYILST